MASYSWMLRLKLCLGLNITPDKLTDKLNDESNDQMEMENKFTNVACYVSCYSSEGTRSDVNNPTCLNQTITTRNKFFQNRNESYDEDFLLTYTRGCILKDLYFDGKKTSQVQDKCEEVVEEYLKCKKNVEHVSSLVIGSIEFLWFMRDICSNLLPQHGPHFIWLSLLEMVSFMVFVCAVLAMIIVGAPFTPLLRGMLMFWAIWMLVRSVKSLTELYLPMLGILLMGCYVLAEKKPPR